MKKRVGVLMGGLSHEREISLKSGKAVCDALKNNGMDVVPVELPKSLTMEGYAEIVEGVIRTVNMDVAFIALHGQFGEDGCVQSILEAMDIPYTGSRPDASRVGMDKIDSRTLFISKDIAVPSYGIITRGSVLDPWLYFDRLGSPIVVKPSNEGSSIGLYIADSEGDFNEAITRGFLYSDILIVEKYISGREITIGILEDKALPPVEIIPKKRFFDYEAKYEKGVTEYKVPAEIEKCAYIASQEAGMAAHMAVGCRCFSRVDMILTDSNRPVVLEINTVPGLTEISLLPMAARAAGITFEELVLKILESALW